MDINRPRIGVYNICKNESMFVERWVTSMWNNGNGADKAFVLDTGSTDDTIERFHQVMKSLGIPDGWLKLETKTYESFRFDTARNDNLEMVTDDDNIEELISVDLDEILIPDFWDDVRACMAEHPNFYRIYYMYAWNHDEKDRPKRVFWYDKLHHRKGAYWKFPVHEQLQVSHEDVDGEYWLDGSKIYLHHYPDNTKSRSSYLGLLEARAQEYPDDIYGLYYLVREYVGIDPKSIRALTVATNAYARILANPEIDAYTCLSYFTMQIADIYNSLGLEDEADLFYRRAIKINDTLRQPYMSYAMFAAYHGRHELALQLLEQADEKAPTKYPTWYETDYNWTWRPLQIKAVAYCWAGRYKEAKQIFQTAVRKYIKTLTDKVEATDNGFYDDYQWLKDYLKKKG